MPSSSSMVWCDVDWVPNRLSCRKAMSDPTSVSTNLTNTWHLSIIADHNFQSMASAMNEPTISKSRNRLLFILLLCIVQLIYRSKASEFGGECITMPSLKFLIEAGCGDITCKSAIDHQPSIHTLPSTNLYEVMSRHLCCTRSVYRKLRVTSLYVSLHLMEIFWTNFAKNY